MQNKREVRSYASTSKLELRKANGKNRISGLAIAFNKASSDMGFIEYISPNALDKTLADTNNQVALLREHSTELLLGRRGVNLDLTVTKEGLRFTCDLLDNATANTAFSDIEAGLLDACSFGFSVPQGGDEWSMVNGQAVRRVNELSLWELSVVYFPAYANVTSVDARQLRAIAAKLTGKRDIDDDCSPEQKLDSTSPCFDPDYDGEDDRSLCESCRAAMCQRCADLYDDALDLDTNADARSLRRKMAALLLRMAAN